MRIIKVNEYYYELNKRKSYGLSYYNFYSCYYLARVPKHLFFNINTKNFYKYRTDMYILNEEDPKDRDERIKIYLICG